MHTQLLRKSHYLSKNCLKKTGKNILETTCDNLQHWLSVRDIEQPIRGDHKGRLKISTTTKTGKVPNPEPFLFLSLWNSCKSEKRAQSNCEFLRRPLWPPRIGCSMSRTSNQCRRLSHVVSKMFCGLSLRQLFDKNCALCNKFVCIVFSLSLVSRGLHDHYRAGTISLVRVGYAARLIHAGHTFSV